MSSYHKASVVWPYFELENENTAFSTGAVDANLQGENAGASTANISKPT